MTEEREVLQYLQDIAEMMTHIREFTAGMDFDAFIKNKKTNFAVFRALEVIGEATKQVPEDMRRRQFVSGMENLKAIALAESPLRFRIRKIFVLENFLSRI